MLDAHPHRHIHGASAVISGGSRLPCLHLVLLENLCTDAFRPMKAAVILHIDTTHKQQPKSTFALKMLWNSASWRRRRVSGEISGASRPSDSKRTGILCSIRLHLRCYSRDHVSEFKSQVWLYKASHSTTKDPYADVQHSKSSLTRRNLKEHIQHPYMEPPLMENQMSVTDVT